MRVACLLILAALGARAGAERPLRDLYSDTWAATDALDRALPGRRECGAPRRGRYVGVFYFLWMERRRDQRVYDITRLLAADPANPAYGPKHAFHWWGRPHLGYYVCDDEFVLRTHARMLANAGVDVVVFDVTNALTYDHNLLTLCKVYRRMRRAGLATPHIAFLANTRSDRVVRHLYQTFYAKGLYRELWFRWKGRPLLLAPDRGLTDEHRRFFSRRQSWAWTSPSGWFGDGRDKWPWLDHHPQKPGWHTSRDRPEQISVCAAQHPTSNIGRSFHAGRQPPPARCRPERGLCFAEQWKRALAVDPEFIFVTGWNEWIAQRFIRAPGRAPGRFLGRPLPPGRTFFVDQYNQEFSRDIEPMHGGHGDNYYYQMVANIRRFKGVRERSAASPARTVRLDAGFEPWRDVAPEFLDGAGDRTRRDHAGFAAQTRYVNRTGRNDFEAAKVARDAANVYFYVRTCEAITPPDGDDWMLLLLDTDADARNGWEGYDLLVNRTRRGAGTCSVERSTGGWSWQAIGTARLAWKRAELHLAVPRALLGPAATGRLRIDFKWADNTGGRGKIMDFIDRGDVAPDGRFNYRYEP